MPTATWNGEKLAEGDDIVKVEGNVYFSRSDLVETHFEPSDHTSVCPWKGTAHYLHVIVGAKRNDNAAWYYPSPLSAASQIKDRVAFWKGVEVG